MAVKLKKPHRIVIATVVAVMLIVSVMSLRRVFFKKTVAEVMVTLRPQVEPKLKELFTSKSVDFPPQHVTLLYIKDEKKVFLYSGRNENEVTFLKTYDVLAASGVSGPKLEEGDRQVPEGVYAIESLNPNSRFYLALRVNYPNSFDHLKSKEDGRSHLGSDIMIHGNNVSVGCLAMGDEAIEELFTLAAITGYTKWKLVFSPTDFRVRTRNIDSKSPQWIAELDQILLREFLVLP